MTIEHEYHIDKCWDGQERRNLNHCESHLDMAKSVAIIETTVVSLDKRINGAMTSIEKHMDQGTQWRLAIVGVATALLIQSFMIVVHSSRMMKQIEINTCRLDQLEQMHPRQQTAEFR
jgi:predicted GNAT superfamily acetyltransferase